MAPNERRPKDDAGGGRKAKKRKSRQMKGGERGEIGENETNRKGKKGNHLMGNGYRIGGGEMDS